MAGRFSVEAVFRAIDQVTGPVRRMQETVGRFTTRMERGLRSVTGVTNSMVGGLKSAGSFLLKVGAVGVGALTAAVTLLTREYSKIENAEAAFTPLMGGAERAKKLIEALNEAAAATPFEFETLTSATSQLLPVMNGDIEKTIATLKKLGDTAGGNAQKLDSITRGYTKAMLKGKVDMESLNMIAEAGVPIFDDLAAVMGVEVGEKFFKMISGGKVTTEQLEAAFTKLTSKGGKFYQGMEIASKTTSGLWSTLMDNISLTAAELGGVLSPIVKELIGSGTDMAQRVRDWVKANRELISGKVNEYVAKIKAGVIAFYEYLKRLNAEHSILDRIVETLGKVARGISWLVDNGAQVATITAYVLAFVVALNVLVGVLTVVNLLMAMNPIGLIVIGIVAAIAAVTALVVWVEDLLDMFEAAPAWVRLLFAPFIAILNVIKLIKDNWDQIVNGGKKIAAFLGFDVTTTEAPTTGATATGPAVNAAKFTPASAKPVANVAAVAAAASPVVNVAPQNLTVNASTPAPAAVSPVVNVSPAVADAAAPVVKVASAVAATPPPVVNVAPAVAPNVPALAAKVTHTQEEAKPAPSSGAQVVTPQERIARSVEEQRTTSTAEVTIKDETGRAEVTKGPLPSNIKLKPSGAF